MTKPAEHKPRPATYELLRTKQPVERTVEVPLDDHTTVTLRFRALGAAAYTQLLGRHQEGKEPGSLFNGETFAPALISASLVEPELTEDQVHELVEDWGTADVVALFKAALDANTGTHIREA